MAVMDSTWGSTHLMRNEVFSSQIKEMFQDETIARSLVNWTNELPDGMNLKINSIGELTLDEAAESTPLPERRMDTGQFLFNIDEYQGVKVAFTDENFQDNFMAPQILARTPEKMMRAFEEVLESKIFATVNKADGGQTKNNSNTINGYKHRMTASGTGRVLTLKDFAYAKLALQKANVPMSNLVAFVDPSVAFHLDTTANIVDISNNPMWQGVVETGMSTGTRFIRNIYGFDVYVSNYLDTASAAETLTTYNGTSANTVAGDKCALFFSNIGGDGSPFLGAFREQPSIVSWRDEAIRTEFHEMRARYGLKLYRPENMLTLWHADTVA